MTVMLNFKGGPGPTWSQTNDWKPSRLNCEALTCGQVVCVGVGNAPGSECIRLINLFGQVESTPKVRS